MTQKNIIGNVASSYQVNLAKEIPNITKIYINSHVFTLGICNAYLNIRHVVGKFFFDWPDIFYSGGLRANWNV